MGWFLFLFGFALNDWSLWCLAALLASAISLHLLVLVEEEHLHRTFGESRVTDHWRLATDDWRLTTSQHLAGHHAGKETFQISHLVEAALLDNPSAIDNINTVCVPDRA